MRRFPGINSAAIPDPKSRRAFEEVEIAIREINASLSKVQGGYQPTSGSASLNPARPAPAAEVATDFGALTPVGIVETLSLPGQTDNLADTAITTTPPAGLYRLSVYCVPTSTVGGGTLTVQGLWEDGTAPGVYFTLATGPSTAGANMWGVAVLYSDGTSDISVNTTRTGAAVNYDLYVALEYLGSMV